jgi:hypothetical protein
MSVYLDVVIYAAIAALAILPAVYVIALNSLGADATIQSGHASSMVQDNLRELNHAIQNSGNDQEALLECKRRIREKEKQLKLLTRHGRNLRFFYALILPAFFWGGAIAVASVAHFAILPPLLANAVLQVIATIMLVLGFTQSFLTLASATFIAQGLAPKLELSVSEPSETSESKSGDKQTTYQFNVVVTNRSLKTAKGVHVSIEIPDRGLILPVSKPKEVLRGDRYVKIAYTPAFDLHAQDSYKQFVLVVPVQLGDYKIVFSPRCDDHSGFPKVVRFSPPKIAKQVQALGDATHPTVSSNPTPF